MSDMHEEEHPSETAALETVKPPPPEHVRKKFQNWAASFARLDPRIRIHRFFQGIAQKGEMKFSEEEIKRKRLSRTDSALLPFNGRELEILAKCFNMASVFTVWRPCSKDAIRKMMEGKGVGKGLDIKGKSAHYGVASGYVPFLQIHNDTDKQKVDWLPKKSRMRVFYADKETRELAHDFATDVMQEMVQEVEKLKKKLIQQRESVTTALQETDSNEDDIEDIYGDDSYREDYAQLGASTRNSVKISITGEIPEERDSLRGSISGNPYGFQNGGFDLSSANRDSGSGFSVRSSTTSQMESEADILAYSTASQRTQAWEMEDPSIDVIDDYVSQGAYGLEMPERLFWEAFVTRQGQHCRKWPLLLKAKKKTDKPIDDDAGKGFKTYCCSPTPPKRFADQLLQQMIAVSEEQDPEAPVIKWVDDANPEEKLDSTNHSVGTGRSITRPDLHYSTSDFTTSGELPSLQDGNSKHGARSQGKKISSWSFIIYDADTFVEKVLKPIRKRDPNFPTKYDRFLGELRQNNFQEQTTGTGSVRFRHTFFQKDRPELCALIGSEHDTGRNSNPKLQDENFKAMRKKNRNEGRQVVLWNMADQENPLCPHNLLMAYEENERVTPVVSDFDGFLVGTKRINFDQPLPPDQIELLKASILTSHEILKGNTAGKEWGDKWKYSGRNHFGGLKNRKPMPRFGYGDGKSYSLMEAAVNQMAKLDGAVRHGAECFNYEFPQEMDAKFLVISDTIDGRVRWKKVDAPELIFFLEDHIKAGYTFPLNPKWILFDPGWYPLYEQLLNSDSSNIQQSLNVWFPPESGIREMIRDIHKQYTKDVRYAAPRTQSSRAMMGLPVVASYNLESTGEDPVKLMISRGPVIQFSAPGRRTALVCAANECCVPICGGVTQAFAENGGELWKDAKALPVIKKTVFGPVRCVTGDAKMVARRGEGPYGNLDASHVIYAVGPYYGSDFSSVIDVQLKDNLLLSAYRASLDRAKEHDIEVVAFSLLSAGRRSSKWDPQRSLRLAMKAIKDYGDFGSLKQIHLCAFTNDEVLALESIAKEFDMVDAATATATPRNSLPTLVDANESSQSLPEV